MTLWNKERTERQYHSQISFSNVVCRGDTWQHLRLLATTIGNTNMNTPLLLKLVRGGRSESIFGD